MFHALFCLSFNACQFLEKRLTFLISSNFFMYKVTLNFLFFASAYSYIFLPTLFNCRHQIFRSTLRV